MEADLREANRFKETSPSKIFLDQQARPIIKKTGKFATEFDKGTGRLKKELRYAKKSIVPERRIQIRKQRPSQDINNFFAHKSEQEVYGDEGLTFFDSQKTQRTNRSTGSLFGI